MGQVVSNSATILVVVPIAVSAAAETGRLGLTLMAAWLAVALLVIPLVVPR